MQYLQVMKHLKPLTITLSFLIQPFSSYGGVNIKDATFYETWRDLRSPGGATALDLKRTYKSRSLGNGFFAFGWCSNIEKSLTVIGPDKITLKDCEFAEDKVFEKVTSSKTQPQIYRDKKSGDEITSTTTGFKRNRVGHPVESYDTSGRLTHLSTPKAFIELKYKSGQRPNEIKFSNNETWQVDYNTDGKIISLKNTKGSVASYQYSGRHLIKSTNRKSQTTRYIYDDVSNLTEILHPDGTREVIQYDQAKDTVTRHSDGKGCVQELATHPPQIDKTSNLIITIDYKRQCEGQAARHVKFDFFYKVEAGSTLKLIDYQMREGEKTYESVSQPTKDQIRENAGVAE